MKDTDITAFSMFLSTIKENEVNVESVQTVYNKEKDHLLVTLLVRPELTLFNLEKDVKLIKLSELKTREELFEKIYDFYLRLAEDRVRASLTKDDFYKKALMKNSIGFKILFPDEIYNVLSKLIFDFLDRRLLSTFKYEPRTDVTEFLSHLKRSDLNPKYYVETNTLIFEYDHPLSDMSPTNPDLTENIIKLTLMVWNSAGSSNNRNDSFNLVQVAMLNDLREKVIKEWKYYNNQLNSSGLNSLSEDILSNTHYQLSVKTKKLIYLYLDKISEYRK